MSVKVKRSYLSGKDWESLFTETRWNKIAVFSIPKKQKKTKLHLLTDEFKHDLVDQNEVNNQKMIPIITSREQYLEIHYVIIMQIDGDINIAMSIFVDDDRDRPQVTGFHINKDD